MLLCAIRINAKFAMRMFNGMGDRMQVYEKLGLFYLGRITEPKAPPEENLLLYESRDLVTHAVCVGMTGSGKTGLCITVLEEAAIDGIPAIIVDPKGDLGNLLLTFPGLQAEEFRPWINEDEARIKGITPEEYAKCEAERWGKGLAEWGQDATRIQRLRDSAEFAIYTPGSTAGSPVSIAASFAAPDTRQATDPELVGDRIASTASGLLGLLGMQADPLRSREHILISNVLDQAWKSGKNLDLASLIRLIQSPPLQRIGVFDLESFYPTADRMQFAMMMNNLLAAPGFGTWLEGTPLDIGKMLYTPQGKPRMCIFSIAHLSDSERMFFVTLLLSQTLGWMRSQPGTASLRALLYMDEIFGFFPPISEPPSKKPLLTLLKQARAYGLGIVLATQNPVDLDYKGLANTGTWFIGRLQTERDRDRLIDGLAGSGGNLAAGMNRSGMAEMIGSLKQRAFLLQNIHEDHPVVFDTRWTLSYLCGPLTRDQIRRLKPKDATASSESPVPARPPAPTAAAPAVLKEAPALPPDIRLFYAPLRRQPAAGMQLAYAPFLLASARYQIINNKLGLNLVQSTGYALELQENMTGTAWESALPFAGKVEELGRQGDANAGFLPVPSCILQGRWLQSAQRSFIDFVYRQAQTSLLQSTTFKLTSQPGESERDFRARLQQLARERRDLEVDKLRQRYASKVSTLQRQLLRSQQRVEREHEQLQGQTLQTAISIGSTLLGAFMGRKIISSGTIGRATTAGRQAARIGREKQDVTRAQEDEALIRQQITDLEAQLQNEIDQLTAARNSLTDELQSIILRPTKSGILVQTFGLLWVPIACGDSVAHDSLFFD